MRQSEHVNGVLTLSLSSTESSNTAHPSLNGALNIDDRAKEDIIVEVLKHMPKRSRKNSGYILDLLTLSNNLISWKNQREIFVNNQTVRGSHFDLVKKSHCNTKNS